ncbi:MAG TPA: inositol monophosphatase family protein [Candidatus Limnocylindria bacterium]|nr:inositol monophosphatase family protein [Candidatus Limnocylindria bacterium]
MDVVALLAIAEDAARAAGAELLARWRGPVSGLVTKSSSVDLASDADRAAEAAVVGRIRERRPDDAILAEEGGATEGRSGIRWLVDPLDGTTNFLYGFPHWSVSVAALEADGAVAAVVLDPVKDECFRAARGGGAWCGGRRLRASDLDDLSLALVATGFSYDTAERVAQARQQVELIARIRDLRRTGSAALDLAYVASGRVDAYVETVASPWDWAAGRLLVTEAGGRATDVPGVRAGVPGICASGAGIHDALLAIVSVQTR